MKKIALLFVVVVLGYTAAWSQNSGKGFNYQAIARDLNGQVLQNQTIILRFSLIPGQYATDPTWQEMQLANTDEFGAFSLIVGHGQRTGGSVTTYADLNYATADYWLKVELKDGSEFYEISFRELLSVPYAEVARNAIPNPAGTILPFAGPVDKIPEDYRLCDGALVDKNTYPALYAVIGNAWGGTTTHFRLPDCRGMFLRGVANGSGNDPDRSSRVALNAGGNTGDNVGSKQLNQFKSHNHGGTTSTNGNHRHDSFTLGGTGGNIQWGQEALRQWDYPTGYAGSHDHTITLDGGNESRPINVYVNYIINY